VNRTENQMLDTSTSLPTNWTALVAQYGTPLAVYNIDHIKKQCRAMRAAFPLYSIYYSLKSNYNPALLRVILDEGLGVDVVSPNELALSLAVGASGSQIVYVENNMTDSEMITAIAAGTQLVIGSLSRLQKYCHRRPNTRVGIRVNADIGASQHARAFTAGPTSKFGIHSKQIGTAIQIATVSGVTIDFLHQHIGSGWLDDDIFIESAEILLGEAKKFPDVVTVDFGGGFGVPYGSGDKPISLDKISGAVSELVSDFEGSIGRRINCAIEPGRYIVAEGVTLLTTVQAIKSGSDGRLFLGTDSGFNQLLRPALYGSLHEIINLNRRGADVALYDVCGNICESTDFFARSLTLPLCEEGDIIAIKNYGAYGAAMASNYNLRAAPAEVFVDNDIITLTRRRASLDDMLSTFSGPSPRH
jgi:diaminopimelate decarboxylase